MDLVRAVMKLCALSTRSLKRRLMPIFDAFGELREAYATMWRFCVGVLAGFLLT